MNEFNLTTEVHSDKLKSYWLWLKIFSLVILLASLIYGIVVFALVHFGYKGSIFVQEEVIEVSFMIRNILLGVSFITVAAGVIIAYVLAKKVAKGSNLALSSADTPIASNLSAYSVYTVIALALLDTIGIYGIIIYIITLELMWSALLIALSFILKILYQPSQNRFINLMQKYQPRTNS